MKPEVPGFMDEDFCAVIETLLPKILASTQTSTLTVSPAAAIRNVGDFGGLLNELGVDPGLHHICARLNGLASSIDYDGKKLLIYVPSGSEISRYYSTWKQSLNKLVSA